MPEHGRPHVEEGMALLLEQPHHEVGRVEASGLLVADRQEEPASPLEGRAHPADVLLQGGQGDPVLGEVHLLRAGSEAGHQRQVAAAAAHRLGHEAPPGRGPGLLDPVQRPHRAVERGVRADRQLRARQVVVDAGREQHDRHPQRGVVAALGDQLVHGQVGVDPTHHDQRVHLGLLQGPAHRVEPVVVQ